jgi:hypothetical protein
LRCWALARGRGSRDGQLVRLDRVRADRADGRQGRDAGRATRLVGFVPDVDHLVTIVGGDGHPRVVPVVNNMWTLVIAAGRYSAFVRDAAGARRAFEIAGGA